MAVISKLDFNGQDVTKYNNSAITNINLNGVDYHFAKNTECDGICASAVEEPIIDMPLSGNSVQQTYSGKNLFNSALWEEPITAYGLTVQYLKDEDCFLLNGTTTSEREYGLKYINIPITKNEVFSLSSICVSGTMTKPASGNNYSVAYFGKSDELNKYSNWTNTVLNQSNYKRENWVCDTNYISAFWFFISAGITFDNYKVKIQLERGSTATDYEPYVGGESSPNPEYPQEIESVGDKTKNIADLSKANTSTTTPHVRFNYDNSTGTIEYTSEPTAYDYLLLYLERDVGYKFEQGKTYYWGADVTVSGRTVSDKKTTVYFGISYDGSVTTGKVHHVYDNTTIRASGSFVYEGQTTIRLVMHANYGSDEPAKVKYEHIFVSEVNEFEPYGYKVPVKVCGKNLFDINSYETFIDISQYEIGEKLTLSTSGSYIIKIADTSGGTALLQTTGNKLSFTMTQAYKDCGKLFVISRTTYFPETKENLMSNNVQLEKGSTSTDFEPYITPIITNIYLNEPLRKIGNYVDYIDYKNKKVVRNINSVNLKDYTWYKHEHEVRPFYYIINVKPLPLTSINTNTKSNILPSGEINTTLDEIGVQAYVSGIVRFRPDLSVFDTLEKWTEYINNSNAYVHYVIAPTEETIDIPEISTFKGTNIFSIDTTIQPSELKINYWKQI